MERADGSRKGRPRLLFGILLGCLLLALVATGTILAGGFASTAGSDPASMGDEALAVYLRERLEGQYVPVAGVTVTGGSTGQREAVIELATESAEAINPDLDRVTTAIAYEIHCLAEERGADLDLYSLILRDTSGAELLNLTVDLNAKKSHWKQDPRLTLLWGGPVPKAIYDRITSGPR